MYRSYVFQRPEFIEYFNAATPVGELGRLNIGSRPAARKQTKGVEGLRAIPWVFAWTQTRFHLPVRMWWWAGGGADSAVLRLPGVRQRALLHADTPSCTLTRTPLRAKHINIT